MRLSCLFLALVVLLGSAHCRTEIHDAVGVRVIEDDAQLQPEMGARRLQDATMQRVLDLHNQYRATVKAGNTPGQPSAQTMPSLKWDAGLAQVAQNYANKCIWGHNGDRTKEYTSGALAGQYVGENLYASSGISNPSGAATSSVTSWYDEYQFYTYDTKKCQSGEQCGHYTQVVWAKTTYVGCATAVCSGGLQGISWSQGTIVVCNYAHGGNFNNEFPYVKGSGSGGAQPTTTTTTTTTSTTSAPGGNPATTTTPTTTTTTTTTTRSGSTVTPCTGLTGTRTTYIRNTQPQANCGDYKVALKNHLPCVSPVTCEAIPYPGLESVYQRVKLQYECDRATWNRGGTDFREGIETALSGMGFKFAGAASTNGQTPTETASVTETKSSSSGKENNTTAVIVGAVVGSAALAIIIGAIVFFVIRRKAQQKDGEYRMMQEGNYNPPTQPLIS